MSDDAYRQYDIPGKIGGGPFQWRHEGTSADPLFSQARRVHDWRNYIGDRVRSIWATLTDEQRAAIADDADDLAGAEDWD